MGNSMKMMNYTMPIMSLVICFTLPAFLGLYWVVQSLVMIIQQWAINKHMEGISVEDIIKEDRDAKMKSSTDYYNAKAADPNSLAARANMVREFNERNSKKK